MSAHRTVLVVDDDKPIRDTIVEILRDEGYEAVAASDGHDALRRLRAADALPGLILLDLMMPVMDGFQFRAEQLADPAIAGIPVVVLSADTNVAAKATTLSVTDVVKKPISLDALLACVERWCR